MKESALCKTINTIPDDHVILKSSHWNKEKSPVVTIVTAVYNMKEDLLRAMESVAHQTFEDIEYIIINDASTENIDEVIVPFMDSVSFPMMYVMMNRNSGPCVARNRGFMYARGQYVAILDGDDEMLPDAVQNYVDAWNSIPLEKRSQYREVVALMVDQENHLVGGRFADNVNELPWKKALYVAKKTHGERRAMMKTSIMKENLFPEPEGVRIIGESVLWNKLEMYYGSWCLNVPTYMYHLENSNSITRNNKRLADQHVVDKFCTYKMLVSNNNFNQSRWCRIKWIGTYCTLKNVLKIRNVFPQYNWAHGCLDGFANRLLAAVLWIPSYFYAFHFIRCRM